MDYNNTLVKEYINQMYNYLHNSNIDISMDFLNNIADKYMDSNHNFEDIKKQIDKIVLSEIHKPLYSNNKCNYYVKISPDFNSNYNKNIINDMFEKGYKNIGIVVGAPVDKYKYPNLIDNIYIDEVDNYSKYISKLKEDNLKSRILSSYIATYSSSNDLFLGKLRDKVDYMILDGVEYKGIKNEDYPIRYAEKICEAMSSGIFDIVLNPDTFISKILSFDKYKDSKEVINNCKKASQKICDSAKKLNITFLISSISDYKPNSIFFDEAAKNNIKILCNDINLASEYIDVKKMNIVSSDYDPVEFRKSNIELNDMFISNQKCSYTDDTCMVSDIIGVVLDNIDNNIAIVDKVYSINYLLDKYINMFRNESNDQDNKIISCVSSISLNNDLDVKDKAFRIGRLKKMSQINNDVLTQKIALINEIKNHLNFAVDIGCESNDELCDIIVKLTEMNHNGDSEKKDIINKYLEEFKNSKSKKHATKKIDYEKKIVKTRKKNKNNGFISSFVISLLTTFGIGMIVGIGFMIYILMAV